METKRSLRQYLANARNAREQLLKDREENRSYIDALKGRVRRLQGDHDRLLAVVAAHIATGADTDHLRKAVVRAGFRAELQWMEHPTANTRPAAKEATP